MATVKTVNYTAEQTAELVNGYKAGMTVEQLSAKFGRNVRSIVAKLSREGAYIKKTEAKKEKGTDKTNLANKIAELANLAENDADSLTKANRQALIGILAALNR